MSLLSWTLFLENSSTVFRVEARTSAIKIVANKDQPVWPASLPIQPLPQGCAKASFKASEGSTITFTQTTAEVTDLTVSAKSGTDKPSAGVFTCAGNKQFPADFEVNAQLTPETAKVVQTDPKGKPARTTISSSSKVVGKTEPVDAAGQPITLRFAGSVTLGSEIDELDPTPMLLESGELTMETKPLIGPGTATSTYRITKGDKVTFTAQPVPARSEAAADSNQESVTEPVTFGLISIDQRPDDLPAFHVVARTLASQALILPYGQTSANPVAVAPDLLTRAQAGAHSIVLGALAALALHTLSLLVIWLELPRKNEEAETV